MNIFKRLFRGKQDRPQKQYASLEEEIEDLRHFYSGSHPVLTDEAWLKESVRSAKEAERAYKNEEAVEHWKRVAALAQGKQEKAYRIAVAQIQELQSIADSQDWEAIAARAVRFAKEAEKEGKAEEAIKHWRRVTMLAPKGGDLWKQANAKLSK